MHVLYPAFAITLLWLWALTVSAEPLPAADSATGCAAVSAQRYKKSLLFTRFQRLHPADSNPGHLQDIDQHLPDWFSQQLVAQQVSTPASQLSAPLHFPLETPPSEAAALTRKLASQYRAQLLVSGTLTDLSMSPDSDRAGLYRRFINGFRDTFNMPSATDKRQRVFSLYLQLRDGITGEPLFDNTYRTTGVWPARRLGDSGFDSVAFRQSDYGRQVWQLLDTARQELEVAIRCQPHIATAELHADPTTLVVHSGANQGLRPGDLLQLHQLVQLPVTGRWQQYDIRLVDQQVPDMLLEVYPDHSLARIESRTPLTGRFVVLGQ